MTEIEEREQIRELYVRYALSIDADRSEDWVACFTEDGVFESKRLGRHAGREALMAFTRLYKEYQAGAQVRHVISNISVRIEGDRATGTCYLTYYHSKNGKSELAAVGGYNDRLRKVDGKWLFEYRKVFVDG